MLEIIDGKKCLNIETYLNNSEEILPLEDFFNGKMFTLDTESSRVKEVLDKKDKTTPVHVYGIGLMHVEHDILFYSNNLDKFMDTWNKLVSKYVSLCNVTSAPRKKLEQINRNIKVKIWVHNLKWDSQFFLYYVKDRFNHEGFTINEKKQLKSYKKANEFSLIENDGQVYDMTVRFDSKFKKKYSRDTIDLIPEFKMIDSMKILSTSLSKIGYMLQLREEYLKMDYNYDTIRPIGYELTNYEKSYLYNDLYILHQFHNKFFNEYCVERLSNDVEFVKGYTASSIGFYEAMKHIKGSIYDLKSEKEVRSFLGGVFQDNILDGKDYIYKPNTTPMYVQKESYLGGWTGCNPKVKNLELNYPTLRYSIDINSSYPSIMLNKKLPVGEPSIYPSLIDAPLGDNYCRLHVIAFDGYKAKDENNKFGFMNLGSHNSKELNKVQDEFNYKGTDKAYTNIVNGECIGHNRKLVYLDRNGATTQKIETLYGSYINNMNEEEFCNNKYVLFIWEDELKHVLKHYDLYCYNYVRNIYTDELEQTTTLNKTYNFLEVQVYKAVNDMFNTFVNKYGELKIKGKLTDDTCLEQFAKLVLNSCYGKFGSNIEKCVRTIEEDKNGILQYKKIEDSDYFSKQYYVTLASYITSMGRVNLLSTAFDVIGHEHVLYMDTDSIYTDLEINSLKIKMGDNLHPTEFGKWDIEKGYNKFKTLGAKKYILNGIKHSDIDKKINKGLISSDHDIKPCELKTSCKCAGLPSDITSKMTFDRFYLKAQFNGKKTVVKVPGGCVLNETSFTISDTLTRF